jgi:hypothetical protein
MTIVDVWWTWTVVVEREPVNGDGFAIVFCVVTVNIIPPPGVVDGDGVAIEFCVVTVNITPGDAVGSVTERLLNVWGGACTVGVCGVTETAAGVDVVAAVATETLLALLIPNILSAVKVLKQPTYTPDVLFNGTAKHDSPAPQDVSLKLPAESQFPVEPLTQAMAPGVQLDDCVSDEKSEL